MLPCAPSSAMPLTHRVTTGIPFRAHAIIPLALFEAVRALDLPTDDGLEEFHDELVVKRLGMNRTVVAQIQRYGGLARADKRVDGEEVTALLRLVGRRADAGLVYAEAGRRAARLAAARVPGTLRLLRHLLPPGFGRFLARRAAADVFGVVLRRDGATLAASMDDSIAVRATPGGAACGFFGSAVAELLRIFTPFDGALLHDTCRGRGDGACHWRAGPPEEE
ncbi:MAG: hypothetical protein HYT81_05805 [Gemmatimonadetes bacterium]|nr:hypothetical protein [Gemmatimonadota bacterium]